MATAIFWFRRDLRLKDNSALFLACKNYDTVIPVFVFDTNILKHLENSDRRVSFIYDSLVDLQTNLKSKIHSLVGDPEVEILKFANKLKAEAVFCNEDYEPYARSRDSKVSNHLHKSGIRFVSCKDQVIFNPQEVLKNDGSPYKVFTPYKKQWLTRLTSDLLKPKNVNKQAIKSYKTAKLVSLKELGFNPSTYPVSPGSSGASKTFKSFLKVISAYDQNRDFPAKDITSKLSIHLRFGTISIRALVSKCWEDSSPGAQTWLSELIWREFYQMILFHFPNVVKGSFNPKYKNIKWPGSRAHFNKWKNGETGFPLVDAAMVHFKNTGWMHNRLRMVVASFLTKDLLCNWKWGEAYFREQLFDYDLAANNGGWQWSAGTGCDAQPYFRVFNPVAQSQKFDPDGDFIRSVFPERKHLSNKEIHLPIEPIVDHKTQRLKAINLFK